ncbi:crotonase/enoyl-CoA hydratase family protein [Leptospira gomenensis]|uniref:Crotonase/enoyl-CoA hydratase family protein n=1 Tax=Leptospira gomenensis TaxID=2484974 RepID=A0A5F1YAY6_9LEPT|nr:crotonase/enoyl-CoA hydratase family protein [Leptospira gomenensis]TGK34569.1 crotonase/enoyl-CoA hydratase family protein [Leptospira gomenensis]TGK40121.1 crotonase/enoyl-CoA hydratase family protein [Leptospira gomenensis]TGK40469.1 crotonase/enoyl-CoA hydratase family protein [Leptospira gomenensis]TGK55630.1 crotonase/enoyl-CoA hydratase family protein [Leptospira gomenensis]
MKTHFEFFEIVERPEDHTAILYLNRPEKRNAMNWPFWRDLPDAIAEINANPRIHAFIIAARGKSFSTGLDLESFFQEFGAVVQAPLGDDRRKFFDLILRMQKGINAVYDSPKPSIAAVQKHCIGGGLDLISACDIRYATVDASISLREAKVAIVADMGSINRLPAIIGQGHTRELALTGKDIDGLEAERIGLVTKVFQTEEEMMQTAIATAKEIAENPKLVVSGIKDVMRYAEGKTLEAGLNYVALWNSSFLDSADFRGALQSFKERKRPIYNQN